MPVKKEIRKTSGREAIAVLLLALGALMLLGLVSYDPGDIHYFNVPPHRPPLNFIGPVGAWVSFVLFMTFGVVGYLIPLAVGVYGLFMMFQREGCTWPKGVCLFMMLSALVCMAELQAELWAGLVQRLNAGSAGGILGDLLARYMLIGLFGDVGTAIVVTAVLIVCLIVLFEVQPIHIYETISATWSGLVARVSAFLEKRRDRREQIEQEQKALAKSRRRLESTLRQHGVETAAKAPVAVKEEVKSEPAPKRKLRKKKEKKKAEPAPEPVPVALGGSADEAGTFTLPGLEILDDLPAGALQDVKEDFSKTANILQETLAEFGVIAEVTNVEKGPVVTRFELLPAAGVRVERIAALSNNIALAMKAESIRVQAPVPGKGVVGIEIPNAKSKVVYLRSLMESGAWRGSKAALPLALGQDVGGKELVADLADMPHLLIAGATGAGKTVCMNSILAGLLMSRTPDQLKLMLVDPKIVEFSGYNNLPHLVVPVITEAKKVSLGLRWAINEMESRYKLFAKVGVRNIKGFNHRRKTEQTELFKDAAPSREADAKEVIPETLPYIVIIIDELADLMMVAQAEVENAIARLAQLSRAVGIHMILATQRPSVNVITGTIKANFPARIAFQVAQKVDSRTILDATGADKLLGKGDMLFLPPGSSKLVRAQGTMTSDGEINRIVECLKLQGEPRFVAEIKEKIESKTPVIPEGDDDDELLEAAVEIIRQTRRASTSSLQRRLRIGYTRAARLMDLLEEKGIVGPPSGSDPREILIDLDGDIPEQENIEEESVT